MHCFGEELRRSWQWKLDDPVLIESDIHSKRIESCEKERRKAELAEKKRLQALEKAERARIPPLELFRVRFRATGLRVMCSLRPVADGCRVCRPILGVR